MLNSVQTIQESTEFARDKLQQSIENLQRQAESEFEVDAMINFDALQGLFNISRDDLRNDTDKEIICNF